MATLTYQGADYPGFDASFGKVTIPEWRQIKAKAGFTVRQFLLGVADVDADALTCLRWLVLRSAGHDDLVLDLDADYSVMEFATSWKRYEDDLEAEQAADPTLAGSLPATPTPEPSGSSTTTSTTSSPDTSQGLPDGAV